MEKGRKIQPVWKLALTDILITGVALLVFAYFHHVRAVPVQQAVDFEPSPDSAVSDMVSEENVSETDSVFADKFTAETVVTAESYSSPDVSVTLTRGTYVINENSSAQYSVEDIYIKDVSCLRTVFANDSYGRSIAEKTIDAAVRTNSVCMVNGDYYGTSEHNLIIRNGELYGHFPKSNDICVLYKNGTMAVYKANEFDAEKAMKDGAWQSWSFGPSLLDSEGKAMTHFNSSVKPNNPRTVVGYYEPGHYCFIAVDGRSKQSAGLTLAQLSSLCEELGLTCAYNLDGGQTTVMTFMDEVANEPFKGGRPCSDFVCVCEPDKAEAEE